MSAFDDYRDLCEERDSLRAELEAAKQDAAKCAAAHINAVSACNENAHLLTKASAELAELRRERDEFCAIVADRTEEISSLEFQLTQATAAAAVPEDVAKYRHHLELLRDDCTYPAGHVGAVVLNGHRMEIIRDALAAILAKIDASKGEVPLPLSALVCVGRARFPRTGGNAGISWHVEDALSDTGGFRSGNPCNGELLFVLPATAKRAMLAASGRQDGAR